MNQHQDIVIWVLTGVITVLGTILWWSIRFWIRTMSEKISEIMVDLKIIGNKNVGFEKDIARIDRNHESHDKRMHDYSERIRELEKK